MEDRGRSSRTYENRRTYGKYTRKEDRQIIIRQEDRELRRSVRVCGGEEKDNA